MSALLSSVEVRRLTYQPAGSGPPRDFAEACSRWRLAAGDYFELIRASAPDANAIRAAHEAFSVAFQALTELGSTKSASHVSSDNAAAYPLRFKASTT